jgi:uncharacterized phage protein (TIGR01671 family)
VRKYRVWDEQGKFWLKDNEVHIWPDGTVSVLDYDLRDTWHDNGPVIVEFWTGLLDKNGKEIYEGDVIKLSGEFEGYIGTCTVVFDAGAFSMDLRNTDYQCPPLYYASDSCEVIGNIHEPAEEQ